MNREFLPSVSFVIPTFNSSKTLRHCLESVFAQDYPQDRTEVFIVDGGSTDETLSIAGEFPTKILPNPSRYEDGPSGGKAIGFRHSSSEIVIFLDSDNELASRTWLRNTVLPYGNKVVVGTFPHLVPKSDGGLLSQYLTITSSGPAIRFWKPEDVRRLPQEDPRYQLIELRAACDLSNGASVRREALDMVGGYDYGFETTKRLIDASRTTFSWPASTDVLHHYVGVNLRTLVRKRVARLKRFKAWEDKGLRTYTTSVYQPRSSDEYLQLTAKVVKSLSMLTVPEAAWRAIRQREPAWLCDPVVSWIDTVLHLFLLRELAVRTARFPPKAGEAERDRVLRGG